MHFEVGEINIICTDLERSLRFYRDVLGFTPIAAEGLGWHMRCGQVNFLLLAVAENPHTAVPYCTQPEFSIDLMIDDLESARQHIELHQVEFAGEFQPNQNRFMIRDPDGLVLEIIRKE